LGLDPHYLAGCRRRHVLVEHSQHTKQSHNQHLHRYGAAAMISVFSQKPVFGVLGTYFVEKDRLLVAPPFGFQK